MPSSDPFSTILIWVLPLLGLLGQMALLVACVVGALHPALRREFTWLALGSAVRCLSAALIIVPQFLLTFGQSGSSAMANYKLISPIAVILSNFSLLLYLVGFILLAIKARSLPVPPRRM